MQRIIAAALILPFLSLTGCSLAVGSRQSINIMPSHPRADVYVDGNLVGKGPQNVSMSKSSSHSIMAKCGGSAGTGIIDRSLSTTGMLDLIGGLLILFPLLGLISAGAWKLNPTTLSVAIPDETACE